MADSYAVELRNISKTYSGGTKKANSNISLGLRRGEILCVAGENGAGKTTLMKILNGLETPDEGSIFINGRQTDITSPLVAKNLGIGMVHQHFMIFPGCTVAENIVMGNEPRKWGIFYNQKKANAIADGLLKAHHFFLKPTKKANDLSISEMQQVEICRLLHGNADIIIMDEPSSVLTDYETDLLFETIRALAVEKKSIILVTHKLREIKQISNRVAVLRKGELVCVRDTAEIDEHEISRLMIGIDSSAPNVASASELATETKTALASNSEPVIVFDNVTVMRKAQKRPLLDKLSFTARAGEVLGFTAAGGNGLGVLEAVLGGFLRPASGKILHRGNDITPYSTRRLRKEGLAYVPADRLQVGSAPQAAVDENIIVNRRQNFSRLGFLNRPQIKEFAAGLINRYHIAGADDAEKTAFLSGGNLQKLILAREIEQFSDYIVFSEPCWGLDIAAGNFVRDEIVELREKGAAVILISTSLDEVLKLADRVIVLYRGKIAGEFVNSQSDAGGLKEKIGAAMQGLEVEIA